MGWDYGVRVLGLQLGFVCYALGSWVRVIGFGLGAKATVKSSSNLSES